MIKILLLFSNVFFTTVAKEITKPFYYILLSKQARIICATHDLATKKFVSQIYSKEVPRFPETFSDFATFSFLKRQEDFLRSLEDLAF